VRKIYVVITFRKSNKNSPLPKQMLEVLPSRLAASHVHAEDKVSLSGGIK
jgi:hypothetical protein